MCGIFGHIGKSSSIDICLKGLKFLEYRGYDSVGIAGIFEGNLICLKEKGRIADLEKLLDHKIRSVESSIGHTRWATHGEASQLNAHPHLDISSAVAVVHNGIIENHQQLRKLLEGKGIAFQTDTDSEVIAQLIAHFYKGDLVKAVRMATRIMKGFWGIALIHKNHPKTIVATCRENPIVIGKSKVDGETFVSSDPYAFLRSDLDFYYLKNDEIALLTEGNMSIFDIHNLQIEKEAEQLDLEEFEVTKGNFEHFMLKEIFEQPDSLQSAIHHRFILEKGTAEFEHFSLTQEERQALQRILILGCGTSWHAACIAAQQLEEIANIPASAEIASEFRYKQSYFDATTLVIAISQSGETFDLIAAVRKLKAKGARILAICNVPGSTLVREASDFISLRAGPEISVCSTKAFTSQLAVLSLVCLKLARMGPMDQEKGREFLQEILSLPQKVREVLALKGQIDLIAQKYAHFPHFFFLGRQYMYFASLEAALKLKEISYLSASGYPAGELKHGPIAMIDPNHVVIGLCGNQTTFEKMVSNLTEVKARKGEILAFSSSRAPNLESVANQVIVLPALSDPLACIPYSVATQLLAYAIAHERGAEIDQPRNLAKSVTVE